MKVVIHCHGFMLHMSCYALNAYGQSMPKGRLSKGLKNTVNSGMLFHKMQYLTYMTSKRNRKMECIKFKHVTLQS